MKIKQPRETMTVQLNIYLVSNIKNAPTPRILFSMGGAFYKQTNKVPL
jgi:hypothetical protein